MQENFTLKTEIPEPTPMEILIQIQSSLDMVVQKMPLDTIQINENISYLHFEHIFPLKAEKSLNLSKKEKE